MSPYGNDMRQRAHVGSNPTLLVLYHNYNLKCGALAQSGRGV